MTEALPEELVPALGPLLKTIGELSERIREYDRKLEEIATEHYPQTGTLRQVGGVGTLTALSFVLVLEDPSRFKRAALWERIWAWFRARISREITIPNSASPRKEMRC